jgi:predicted deacylase
MTFQLHETTFSGDTPGTTTSLYWYTAGPEDAAVKVHLQAALHADEQPGTMALHHLLPMLAEADAAGALKARFVIFPSVNPLGLANRSLRHHIGRYDIETGVNYNRRWPDLYPLIADAIAGKLGADPKANIATIRAAVGAWIAAQKPGSAAQQLRLFVLQSAHDADIVLDLHCDDDSLMHIFTSPELMPGLQDLADWMGIAATLTAEDSGGGSFDEVLPSLYRKARLANPEHPIPNGAETATLEYRGRADSFDALGKVDAEGLFGFFRRSRPYRRRCGSPACCAPADAIRSHRSAAHRCAGPSGLSCCAGRSCSKGSAGRRPDRHGWPTRLPRPAPDSRWNGWLYPLARQRQICRPRRRHRQDSRYGNPACPRRRLSPGRLTPLFATCRPLGRQDRPSPAFRQ